MYSNRMMERLTTELNEQLTEQEENEILRIWQAAESLPMQEMGKYIGSELERRNIDTDIFSLLQKVWGVEYNGRTKPSWVKD